MSGPPCQHCTAIGKQMGIKDALRAEPFFRVMEVAKELDRRGELLVVCYENTPAILLNLQNGVFAELLKEWWSANMPTWTEFDIWTLDAKDHGTRVSRIRVFLVSCPLWFRDAVHDLTPEHFEKCTGHTPFIEPAKTMAPPFESFLDKDVKPVPQDIISKKMKKHFRSWAGKFKLLDVNYATTDCSRNPKNKFKARLTKDAPYKIEKKTLTVRNKIQ